MVLGIGSYKFIQILSHNESLITNAFHHTWNHDNIDLFPFGQLLLTTDVLLHRVEYHLYDLFGYGEKLNALVHQIFL